MSDESLIEAMHDDIYRLLTRLGIDDLTALRESGALCEDLQRRFGGRGHTYVPAPDKTQRNAAITADLANGMSAAECAKKHGVHPNTVKNIRTKTVRENLGFGSDDWVL